LIDEVLDDLVFDDVADEEELDTLNELDEELVVVVVTVEEEEEEEEEEDNVLARFRHRLTPNNCVLPFSRVK